MKCLKLTFDEWLEIFPYLPYSACLFSEDPEEFRKYAKAEDGSIYLFSKMM